MNSTGNYSFGWVCALALGLVSGAASAGVFDDAIWVMNPDDLNGDGVAQTGEIMNRLKGAVSDVAGSLRFDAGSSWANASAVSVGGTGTLLLEGSRQIGKSAVLELADEGVVSIPDGKRLTVAACMVDGTKIENGVYTYETAPDALKAHLAATTGKLRVGRLGMVILVR